MAKKAASIAIVSFDGLSAEQFEIVLAQLPSLRGFLKDYNLVDLDAAPFTESVPIWAEILTGAPWSCNGCAGYATALRSLNELKQFTEADLKVPLMLLDRFTRGEKAILINVPLIEPHDETRMWLAEASCPTTRAVSPNHLLISEPFKSYKPRPIISMGLALSDPTAATQFIAAETTRIACARRLAQDKGWKLFVYRSNIFDQLSHIHGTEFLNDQLRFNPELKELFKLIDSTLVEAFANTDKIVFISAFSHTACKEAFSLNDLFRRVGLLKCTAKQTEANALRRAAFAAITTGNAPPLVSMNNQVDTAETICASPIRGGVYMNSKQRFKDGIVDSTHFQSELNKVLILLRNQIDTIAGAHLVLNEKFNNGVPDIMIDIPGADLVDSLSGIRRYHDLPHSVHRSKGFVYSHHTSDKPIRPTDMIELIADLL